MVSVTEQLKSSFDFKVARKYSKFIDSIRIWVRGGPGGMGYPKFGGQGGKGGDVILESKEDITLKNLQRLYPEKEIVKAEAGKNSHERCLRGLPGSDRVIQVPVGITAINDHNQILGELNEEGTKLVVAKGGPGGCKETGYSGMRGDSLHIRLDLKLIADVGLVGFPNAGKSTLLKAISKAKPKIASYPFTTITPNVGTIHYPDLRTITVADLPGLIEGAHRNVGMGHRFLRHCERTKLLLILIDIQGFQLNLKNSYRTPLETVVLLNKELEMYKDFLLDKPAMLVVNKMDTENAKEKFKEIEESLKNFKDVLSEFPKEIRPLRSLVFDEIVPISAKFRPDDVDYLKNKLRTYIDLHDEEQLTVAESELRKELEHKLQESGDRLL